MINYSFTRYENILDIYLVTMINKRSMQEFNAAVQAKFEEFKEAFIEQIESDLKEILKDESEK